MTISLHYFEYSEWRLMSSGGKIVLDSNIQELRIKVLILIRIHSDP